MDGAMDVRLVNAGKDGDDAGSCERDKEASLTVHFHAHYAFMYYDPCMRPYRT